MIVERTIDGVTITVERLELRLYFRGAALILVSLATLISFAVLTPDVLAKEPAAPTQVWSVDLSKDPDFSKREHADNSILLRTPTLDFLDDDRIVLAFDDNSRSIPETAGRAMQSFAFHVAVLDADHGKTIRQLAWQVQNSTSQAMAVGKGHLLVLVGEQLKELSSTFEELASVTVPLKLHGQPTPVNLQRGRAFLNPDYERWQADVAPGGTRIILAHDSGPDVTVEWLNAADLRGLDTTSFSGLGLKNFFAGNSSVLVWVRNLPPMLVTSSGKPRNICECRPEMARMLTDDIIFLAFPHEYKIVSVSGELRSSGKLRIGAHGFHRAWGGSRFAYGTGFYKGSSFRLPTEFTPQMTVHILDLTTLKEVAELPLVEPGVPDKSVSRGFRQSAIALSTDGHRLLVLVNSTLTLYRVP